MADQVVVSFDFPGVEKGEQAVRMLKNMESALREAKGSGKALEEMRKIFVGMKGAAPVLQDLASAVRDLNSASEKMSQGMSKSFDRLAKVIKTEFAELKQIMKMGGASMAQSLDDGFVAGSAKAGTSKRYRSIVKEQVRDLQKAYEDELRKGVKFSANDLIDFKSWGVNIGADAKALLQDITKTKQQQLKTDRDFLKAKEAIAQQEMLQQEKQLKYDRQFNKAREDMVLAEMRQQERQLTIDRHFVNAQEKIANDLIAINAKKALALKTANIGTTGRTLGGSELVGQYTPFDALKVARNNETLSSSFKKLSSNMGEAHSAARGLAAGFNALFLTWGQLGPLLAGAAISFGTRAVIQQGAEVQNTMEVIRVLSEESTQAVSKLNTQMIEMARVGPYGPQEVAKAMKTLSLAGLNAVEVGASIRDVLNFAVGGDTSIEKAADVLTSVATAFSISAEGYNVVGDVIAKTAAVSKASVESIGEAFKTASVINKQYGASLNDVGLGLALLANLGIQGTAAGTALRNMYVDLSGRTPKVQKALASVGLELRNANGDFKDLITIMKELDGAMQKMSNPLQRKQFLADISSERGMKPIVEALDALQRKAREAGNETISYLEEMQQKILDHGGFIVIAAAQMALTPLNQMKSVASNLQATIVETFQGMEPVILSVSAKMREIFQSTEFKTAIENIVVAVSKLTIALLENLDVISKLVAAYAAFKVASFVASMLGGIAASAMAASVALKGMATAQAALAGAGAAAGLAGFLGGLGRVVAFLAGPFGIAIGTAITAWQLYGFFTDKAGKDSKEFANSSYSDQLVQRLREETARLDENTEALRQNITLQELRDRKSNNDLQERMGADASQKVIAAQKQLAKDKEAIQKLNQTEYAQSAGGANDLKKLQAQAALSESKLAQARDSFDIAQKDVMYAKIFAQNAARRNEQEVARQQKEFKERTATSNPLGTDYKPPARAGKAFAEKETLKSLGVSNDNILQQIEKRQADEQSLLKSGYEKNKQITDAQHQAEVITEGAYQAQLFRQAQEYDSAAIGALNNKYTEYTNAYLAKQTELQKALEKAQDEGNINEIQQRFENLQNSYETFTQQNLSAKAKIDEEATTRMTLGLIKLEGAYNKIAKAEDEYWKKEQDETNKIRTVQMLEKQFQNLNTSVFSTDSAMAAAAKTGAVETEKLNAKLADLTKEYKKAAEVADEFMLANLGGLAAGDADTTKFYNELRKIQDAAQQRKIDAESKGATVVADRAQLAFEKVRDDQIAKFNSDLTDAMETAIFEGGKAGGKKFVDVLKNELLRKPFRVVLEAVMGLVSGTIMSGIGSLFGASAGSAAGGASGLISGIGAASGAANFLGGGMAGGVMNGLGAWGAGGSVTGVLSNPGLYSGAELLGAVSPILLGVGALFALAKATKGETRAGGQYGYAFDGSVTNQRRGTTIQGNAATFLEGPSGGDTYGTQVKESMNNTVTGLNKLFKDIGTSATLTGFVAGYESSGKGRGGVYSGGTLSTGASFGESGTGDNYAGTLFESTSTQSPDLQTAVENLSVDFLQSTVQALQALPDAPGWIMKKVAGIDAEALGKDEVTKLVEEITTMTSAVGLLRTALASMPFANTADLSFDTAAALIELAGSLDVLSANIDTYYQNFFSDEERRAQTIKNLTKSFGDLGIPMIDLSVGAEQARTLFRSLVESQDLSTEAGQKAYVGLLSLAGAFASVTDSAAELSSVMEKLETKTDTAFEALERAIDAQKEIAQASYDAAQEAVNNFQSIFDLLDRNIKELYNSVSQTAGLSAAQGNAVINQAVLSGTLPSEAVLSEAIGGARGGLGSENFGTKFEQDIATLALAGKLTNLKGIAQTGLTTAETELAIAKAQLDYLDQTLKNAKEQLDVLRGIDVSITSVDAALASYFDALNAEKIAKNKPPASATAAPGGAVFGGGGSGGGSSAPATKYSREIMYTGGSTFAGITDEAENLRLDSLQAIVQGYNGTGNLQGLLDSVSGSGYTLSDLATVTGFKYSDWLASLDSIGYPRFAAGGSHSGGMRLVGEYGPEWEFTGASRIWNQEQVGRAVSGVSQDTESELATLREDNRVQQGAIARLSMQVEKNTRVMSTILDKWDKEGLPMERDYTNG